MPKTSTNESIMDTLKLRYIKSIQIPFMSNVVLDIHMYIYANIHDVYFQSEIKGLAKVEKVLLDTADSVMDTKRKIEFGVKNIAFKVSNAGF